jgi:hypothetical protein
LGRLGRLPPSVLSTSTRSRSGSLTNFNVCALELEVFSIMAPNLRAFRVLFVRVCVTFFAAERRHFDYFSLHSFEPQCSNRKKKYNLVPGGLMKQQNSRSKIRAPTELLPSGRTDVFQVLLSTHRKTRGNAHTTHRSIERSLLEGRAPYQITHTV